MKKLLLIMAIIANAVLINAQNTKVITGAVIDKFGNPIPNALVEATGGAESVMTDADGTFSIEVSKWLKSLTAKYAGMKDNTKNVKYNNYVLFEMGRANNYRYFVNVVPGLNLGMDSGDSFLSVGVMGGMLFNENWGAYGKFQLGCADRICPGGVLGCVTKLTNNLYYYLGAGISSTLYMDYEYYEDDGVGPMFDTGIMINCNKINILAGYSGILGEGLSSTFNIGIGYMF